MSGQPSPPLLRRAGAVVAGLAAIFVLSLGTDAALHATSVFPPWGQPMADVNFVVAFLYRSIYAVLGCALTARLAPDRPMRHALVLGLVGLVLSTAGAIATWNAGPAFGPHWYPVSLVLSSLPLAWVGGRIVEGRTIPRLDQGRKRTLAR